MISDLYPQAVFRFFHEICLIPHPSGKTSFMQKYLVNFAKIRKLKYVHESCGNVIIYKDAAPDTKNSKPLILQGHMDMVAVCSSDSPKDLDTEAIEVMVDGEFIRATDSSLGADDGIAVAYMLAILDGNIDVHPDLICVFTVDEETGMTGAKALNPTLLQGAKHMINMDSEEEGILTCGCAGGIRAKIDLAVTRIKSFGISAQISISGLLGGHSGVEIHKGRANANILLGRILYTLLQSNFIKSIGEISGGTKDNVICPYAFAVVLSDKPIEKIVEKLNEIQKRIYAEFNGREKGMSITIEPYDAVSMQWLYKPDAIRLSGLISTLPDGVCAMSQDIDGLVESSQNLGILRLGAQDISATLGFSLRSSIYEAKLSLTEKLSAIAHAFDAKITFDSDYPSWRYAPHSFLRETICSVYEKMFGKKMEVTIIHAGLECGYFIEKIPELDCVSLGPDIFDVHTPNERLSVASVGRTWDFISAVLHFAAF